MAQPDSHIRDTRQLARDLNAVVGRIRPRLLEYVKIGGADKVNEFWYTHDPDTGAVVMNNGQPVLRTDYDITPGQFINLIVTLEKFAVLQEGADGTNLFLGQA